MFGGRNATHYFTDVYKWNLSKIDSSFEYIAATPTTWFFSSFTNSAVLIDDSIYFIGMWDSTTSPWTTQTVHAFNTIDATWSDHGTIHSPRKDACLATNNTHIFMADGVGTSESHETALNIYHAATSSWSSVPLNLSAVGGWRDQFCSIVDNALYIWGGRDRDDPDIRANTDAYKVDLSTLRISTVDIADAPQIASGVAVHDEGSALSYAVGGRNLTTTINISAYEFEGGRAFAAFSMFTAVQQAAVALVDHQIYIFGGDTGSWNHVDYIQICDLSPASPSKSPITSSTTSATADQATATTISTTGYEQEDEIDSANTKLEHMPQLVIIGVIAAAVCVCFVCVVLWFAIRCKKNLQSHDQVKEHGAVRDPEDQDDNHNMGGYTVEGERYAHHRHSEGDAAEVEESRSSGNTSTGGDITVVGGTKA